MVDVSELGATFIEGLDALIEEKVLEVLGELGVIEDEETEEEEGGEEDENGEEEEGDAVLTEADIRALPLAELRDLAARHGCDSKRKAQIYEHFAGMNWDLSHGEDGEEDEESEEAELRGELADLDRAGLRARVKQNDPEFRVTKQMTDDDLRDTIVGQELGEENDEYTDEEINGFPISKLLDIAKSNDLEPSPSDRKSQAKLAAWLIEALSEEE